MPTARRPAGAAKPRTEARPRAAAPLPLAGRTALVTGSGRNIGRGIALAFARAGANVVVNGHRDRDALDTVVEAIEALGSQGLATLADVADPRAIKRMVRAAERRFGAIDIAVSNVGMRLKQPFLSISARDWERTLATNLDAAFHLAQAVLPGMQRRGFGRLIHISGVDGFATHVPQRAHNTVCKAGLHALARAIALEFGRDGITANTVAPGVIDTERDWAHYADPTKWRAMRLAQIPLNKFGRIDDVAAACVYLAADSGAFVTGQVIHVNGGQFMF